MASERTLPTFQEIFDSLTSEQQRECFDGNGTFIIARVLSFYSKGDLVPLNQLSLESGMARNSLRALLARNDWEVVRLFADDHDKTGITFMPRSALKEIQQTPQVGRGRRRSKFLP